MAESKGPNNPRGSEGKGKGGNSGKKQQSSKFKASGDTKVEGILNDQIRERETLLNSILDIQEKLNLSTLESASLHKALRKADVHLLRVYKKWYESLARTKDMGEGLAYSIDPAIDRAREFSHVLENSNGLLEELAETAHELKIIDKDELDEILDSTGDLEDIYRNIEEITEKINQHGKSVGNDSKKYKKILQANQSELEKINSQFMNLMKTLKGIEGYSDKIDLGRIAGGDLMSKLKYFNAFQSDLSSGMSSVSDDLSKIVGDISNSVFELNSVGDGEAMTLERAIAALQEKHKQQSAIHDKVTDMVGLLKDELQLRMRNNNVSKKELALWTALLTKIELFKRAEKARLENRQDQIDAVKRWGTTFQKASRFANRQIQNMSFDIDRFIGNLPGGEAIARALAPESIAKLINDQIDNLFNRYIGNIGKGMSGTRAMTAALKETGSEIKSIVSGTQALGLLLVGLGIAYSKINSKVTDMSEALGVSYTKAWDLYKLSLDMQTSLSNRLSTRQDILDAMVAAAETNSIIIFDESELSKISDIGKALGYGAGAASSLNSILEQLGVPKDIAPQLQLIGARLAEASGISSRLIARDIVDNANELGIYFSGYPKKLYQSVIEMRKLGTSIDRAVKVSEGLLDMESSLTAEFEASAALGRHVNLQQARHYAILGDLGGVMREITEQIQLQGDLNDLAIWQKKLLAKALNLEYSEMLKMGVVQEKLAQFDPERRKEMEKYLFKMENLSDMTTAQIELEYERRKAADKLSAQWDKVGNQFMDMLLPVTEVFVDLLSDFAPIISPFISLLKLIGLALKFLKPLFQAIALPIRLIGVGIETINELLSDTVETGTAWEKFTSQVKEDFSGILNFIDRIFGTTLGTSDGMKDVNKEALTFKEILLGTLNTLMTMYGLFLGSRFVLGKTGKLFGGIFGKLFGFNKGLSTAQKQMKTLMTSAPGPGAMKKTSGFFNKLFNVGKKTFSGLGSLFGNIFSKFKMPKFKLNLSGILSKLKGVKIPKLKLNFISNLGNLFKGIAKKFKSSNNLMFDSALGRWRDLTTGRFTKAPVKGGLFGRLLGKFPIKKIRGFGKLLLGSFRGLGGKLGKLLNLGSLLTFIPKFNLKNLGKLGILRKALSSMKSLTTFIPKFNLKNLKGLGKITTVFSGLKGKASKILSNLIPSKFSFNLIPKLGTKNLMSSLSGIFKRGVLMAKTAVPSMLGTIFSGIKKSGLGIFDILFKRGAAIFRLLGSRASKILPAILTGLPLLKKSLGGVFSGVARGTKGIISGIGKSLTKGASKEAGKVGVKSLAKVGGKGIGKFIGKGVGKLFGKGMLKGIAKKIPGISVIAGGAFAIDRLLKGDYMGAGLELLSGVAGTIPGLGTAASIGIDAALMARDIAKENKEVKDANTQLTKSLDVNPEINVELPSEEGSKNDLTDNIQIINNPPTFDPTIEISNTLGDINVPEPNVKETPDINNIEISSANLDKSYTTFDSPQFNDYTGDMVQNIEKSFLNNNVDATLETPPAPDSTMVTPIIPPTEIRDMTRTVENIYNQQEKLYEPPDVSLDTKRIEQLLVELNQNITQVANRPVEVNIGDQEISKMNDMMRVINAQ